ncbi:hypothetical protein [Herbaspirillum huttiense]|uniref:hypothetical protein n=1 Tax=Herbaspirillum huttiense TaxID=863372 RepID=UPI002176B537|nr:hypothetical protein [Herbaspirillum huttiense]UWE15252.1 hypothetical protein NY669_19450 [Herbaspirillum huttiense]
MDKLLRAFIRSRGLKLAGLRLPDALEIMSDFWNKKAEIEVHHEDGDALVAYEDVTDHGRGIRLEIGLIRLLRLPVSDSLHQARRAVRLRLRLCYKWDMDIIRDVLPHGTWSIACWSVDELLRFKQEVQDNAVFQAMCTKVPTEVNITLEDAIYPETNHRPNSDQRQSWWGVV